LNVGLIVLVFVPPVFSSVPSLTNSPAQLTRRILGALQMTR